MKWLLKKCSCLICSIFILIVSTSCSNNDAIVNYIVSDNYNKFEIELLDTFPDSSSEYNDLYINLLDYKDGKLGLYVYKTKNTENDEQKINLFEYAFYDIKTKKTEILASEDFPVNKYFRNPDNTVTEIAHRLTENKEIDNFIKVIDSGNVIKEIKIKNEKIDDSIIENVVYDNEHIYVTWLNDSNESVILVYDYDYNLVTTYEYKKPVEALSNYDYGCIFYMGSRKLSRYDSEKEKFVHYDKIDYLSYDVCCGDSEYDFYYTDTDYNDEGVSEKYLIGYKNGECYKILSYNEMGFSDSVSISISDNEGGFYATEYCSDEGVKLYHIKKSDSTFSVKDNKKIVRLVGIGNFLDEYVSLFNSRSDEYYVESVDYYNDDDYDNALKKLYLDAQTSEDIDIINIQGLNKNDFIDNGIIENLNETYLNKEGNIGIDNFTQPAINAMTNEKGEIYSLFNEYKIGGIWGRADFDKSKIDSYIEDENTDAFLYADTNVYAMVWNLIGFSESKYLDVENKTTNLNDDFKNLLKLVKKHNSQMSRTDEDGFAVFIKENKSELVCEDICCAYDFFFFYKLYGDSIACYTDSGKPVLKPCAVNLAVSSKAHNKEGAYEFLNFVFDYNNYNDISKNYTEGFPTLKENEEDWKQEIMATDTYTDRYGKTYTPTDLENTMGGYECIIPPITNEEYDLFEKMLYSAEYIEPMPSKYYDIIDEELKAYILDKKSLDDTIKSIDNRVTNALNE